MRPLRYSINVTLDGCRDPRAIVPDEELHRHHAENLARADAFYYGARLQDPARVLLGSGKQNRFIRLPSASTLAEPAVEALLQKAIARATVRLPQRGRGYTLIKSVSVKQRPRRAWGTKDCLGVSPPRRTPNESLEPTRGLTDGAGSLRPLTVCRESLAA